MSSLPPDTSLVVPQLNFSFDGGKPFSAEASATLEVPPGNSINELNVAARSTPQDFARMGIHTQFDARNPVHMRALSKAASGPTNNNVLASASYEL